MVLITDEPKGKNVKKSQTIRMLITTLLFVVVVGLIIAFDFEKIKTFISHAGVWGILISIIIYGLLGFTLVPSEPLTLLIAAMFGPWVAMIASFFGNTLSAIAEYFLGHRIGNATNFIEKKEKLPFGLGKMKIDSPAFLILGRMIPGYGPKAVGIVAGVYHVPFWRYVWTAIIPLAFGSAIFAFGGSGLEKLLKFKI